MSLAKKWSFVLRQREKRVEQKKKNYFLLLAFPADIDSQALQGRGRKCSKVAQIEQVV